MAKKNATGRRSAGQVERWQKLRGVTFCLGGRWTKWEKHHLEHQLTSAGAKIVDKVSKALTYLVVKSASAGSTSAAEKEVIKLNAKSGANIQVVDETGALQLALPTREETIAMISAGEEGVKAWNKFGRPQTLDLSGVELPKAKLQRVQFWNVRLDGSNFEGADLSHSDFPGGKSIRLDGANLQHASVTELQQCSMKRLDATGAHLGDVVGCDLDGATLENASIYDLKQSTLRNANCRKIDLRRYGGGGTVQADFTGADLTQAQLDELDLSGAVFCDATLVQANLRSCKLHKADLTGADLRNAQLRGADLTGAKVDGANFEGAILVSAKLDGVDCSKAKGLDPTKTKPPALGPALRDLDKLSKKSGDVTIKIEVALDDGYVEIEIGGNAKRNHYRWCRHVPGVEVESEYDDSWGRSRSYYGALAEVVDLWKYGTLRFDSVKVSSTKSPLKGKQLKDIVTAAVCEAFGVEMPSEEDLKKQTKERQTSSKQARDELLQQLLGKGGVKKFNAHTPTEIAKAGSFARTDFAGAKLDGVRFPKLDLQSAKFEGATLAKAKFEECKCNQASFNNAKLQSANLQCSGFNGADFTRANLSKANLELTSLRKAVFTNAKLIAANLKFAELSGADLSTADLEGAKLSGATFDEATQFPQGYKLPEDMNWRGKGANPALLQAPKLQVGSLSTEDFMKRLAESVEAERLKKALKMLKAERFQLYAQVTGQGLVGVVKSQTDLDLVYSCQLNRDGAFACCTQNLNICGGLRGALCKHLLVLIVGLANSGEIDAAEIDNWIVASKAHKPELDKDVMAETFLRYKGAEAGQIDWRPTETVPEDFYAF